MRITNKNIRIKEGTYGEYYINLEYVFSKEQHIDTDDQQMFKFMADIIKTSVDQNFNQEIYIDKGNFSVVNISNGTDVDVEVLSNTNGMKSLSVSEKKVWDYIHIEVPAGKKSEIVWRWPTGKAVIPESLEKFINCTLHNEPRVARYSYEKRMNPKDQTKHNFWISHLKMIDGDWCTQDLKVDKLVELYDVVAAL